jgi:hypothetical protein
VKGAGLSIEPHNRPACNLCASLPLQSPDIQQSFPTEARCQLANPKLTPANKLRHLEEGPEFVALVGGVCADAVTELKSRNANRAKTHDGIFFMEVLFLWIRPSVEAFSRLTANAASSLFR